MENRVAPFLLTFGKRQRIILRIPKNTYVRYLFFSVTQRKIIRTIPPIVDSNVSPPDRTVVLFSIQIEAIWFFHLTLQVLLNLVFITDHWLVYTFSLFYMFSSTRCPVAWLVYFLNAHLRILFYF
jgi:hypothetical protein